jgi:hypothetical protein
LLQLAQLSLADAQYNAAGNHPGTACRHYDDARVFNSVAALCPFADHALDARDQYRHTTDCQNAGGHAEPYPRSLRATIHPLIGDLYPSPPSTVGRRCWHNFNTSLVQLQL